MSVTCWVYRNAPANLPGERVAFQPHPSQNLLQTGRCREPAAIVALSQYRRVMSHYFIDKHDPRVIFRRLEKGRQALINWNPPRPDTKERFVTDEEYPGC